MPRQKSAVRASACTAATRVFSHRVGQFVSLCKNAHDDEEQQVPQCHHHAAIHGGAHKVRDVAPVKRSRASRTPHEYKQQTRTPQRVPQHCALLTHLGFLFAHLYVQANETGIALRVCVCGPQRQDEAQAARYGIVRQMTQQHPYASGTCLLRQPSHRCPVRDQWGSRIHRIDAGIQRMFHAQGNPAGNVSEGMERVLTCAQGG